MKKKYSTPTIKLRTIESESILDASQLYNEVGTGGQKAKGNIGYETEGAEGNANSTNIWNTWDPEDK